VTLHDVLLILASGSCGALTLALAVVVWPQPKPRRDGFEVRRDRR
jgi:hypothetical protein